MGKIYRQPFIDAYTKVTFAKIYDRKNALVAADMLNDKVLPFYEEQNVDLLRILTDRGTEYCGNREQHEYPLYLSIEDIDHTKIKAKSPQTNGICERFHRTIQEGFYAIAFRKKIYHSLEQMQTDIDAWIEFYNTQRPHTGRFCYGKTPAQTWQDSKELSQEKELNNLFGQFTNFKSSDKAETGAAEVQPVRNIRTDKNNKAVEKSQPLSTNYFQTNA